MQEKVIERRFEEKYKLVLRKFFKYLKQQRKDLCESSEVFKKALFEELEEDVFRSLFSFNNERKTFKFPLINVQSLKRLFECQGFKREFKNYITSELELDHNLRIESKLFNLTAKLREMVQYQKMDILTGVCKIIQKDSKFKLPNTKKEVLAIIYFI